MQKRWNAFVSTLLLFGVWAAFHIPFFLYRFPFGLGGLVGFLLGLFAGAVWLTYLYNSTGGSVLTTMVWHSLFNVVNAIALVALPGRRGDAGPGGPGGAAGDRSAGDW